MSNRFSVSNEILSWLPKYSGKGYEAFYARYSKYDEWLAGTLNPTFNQIMDLAIFSNVPLGYMYLQTPPNIAEKEIADFIELYLKNENYEVFKYYSGAGALECVKQEQIDLAILDVMLPDIDGFEILKEIRKDHNFPVIMLTAKTASMDKINGLTLGADDYIEKPFEPLELMARVKAQLRRFIRYNDGSGQSSEDTLEIAGLVLNRNTHQCLYGEEEVTLTPLEFSILWILTKNKGKVISSENLFEQVWKEKYFKNNNNTVMVHIRHLREKLGEVMGHKELIKTVWGVGYKVEE